MKWARSTRDIKRSKIQITKDEVRELKKEINAKCIMINLLRGERHKAQERMKAERKDYRNELFNYIGHDIHQLDSRYLESLSSDVEHYPDDRLSVFDLIDSDVVNSVTEDDSS